MTFPCESTVAILSSLLFHVIFLLVAFDGEKYVGHAWNQIYLKDENKWINVDTTFYDAGNYFDSNLFNEHKVENIAGEW